MGGSESSPFFSDGVVNGFCSIVSKAYGWHKSISECLGFNPCTLVMDSPVTWLMKTIVSEVKEKYIYPNINKLADWLTDEMISPVMKMGQKYFIISEKSSQLLTDNSRKVIQWAGQTAVDWATNKCVTAAFSNARGKKDDGDKKEGGHKILFIRDVSPNEQMKEGLHFIKVPDDK